MNKIKIKISKLMLFIVLSMTIISSVFADQATVGGISSRNISLASIASEGNGNIIAAYTPTSSLPTKYEDIKLYPGGIPFGVKFYTKGIVVIGFSDIEDSDGKSNPAYDAGIRLKDIITKVNGKEISRASELTNEVERSKGASINITYIRGGREFNAHITPKYSSAEGRYKSGLWIRDSGAGIGTLTFVDPESLCFGGLGHGICDGDTGELIPMNKGSVLDVKINGIVKGASGAPGEIKGYFSSGKTGTLISNTACGVYGILGSLPKALPCEPLSPATRDEIYEGTAYIWCTLDNGAPQKYSIKISDIDRSANGNKCFVIKVTDGALIEKTGGIVQGMSGSPIIQNGKLVGAVTHVLINDPTTGYGIFIENMLNASQQSVQPKAA